MIHEFKTLSGKKLTFDDTEFTVEFNREVKIKEDLENYLKLLDNNNQEVLIPKEIITSNKLSVEGGMINLPRGLYDQYFKNQYLEELKDRNQETDRLLYNNFSKIVANKDLILNNESYYLIRPDFLVSAIYSDPKSITLGTLLEAWHSTDELLITPHDYVVNIRRGLSSGSILSWNGKEKQFNTYHDTTKKGTLIKNISAYYELKLPTLQKQYMAIENLLNEIK